MGYGIDIKTSASGLTGTFVNLQTSTDNAVVRFNGTGGEVQNSGITISNTDVIALPAEAKITVNSSGTNKIMFDDSYSQIEVAMGTGGDLEYFNLTSDGNGGDFTKAYLTYEENVVDLGYNGYGFSVTNNVVTLYANGATVLNVEDAKMGFFNTTAVVQPTALTAAETTLTFVDENTPDFALSSLTTTSAAGFATLDEAQAFVEVVVNMQVRVGELETKLSALGLTA